MTIMPPLAFLPKKLSKNILPKLCMSFCLGKNNTEKKEGGKTG